MLGVWLIKKTFVGCGLLRVIHARGVVNATRDPCSAIGVWLVGVVNSLPSHDP